MKNFPFFRQLDEMDCGPTCLQMISKYYGKNISIKILRELCSVSKTGVSLLDISEAAEQVGFKTLGAKLKIEELKKLNAPAIIHWKQYHFVILYKVKNNVYFIADPALGLLKLKEEDFIKCWLGSDDSQLGYVMFLEVTSKFEELNLQHYKSVNWKSLLQYLQKYRKLFFQLTLGILGGTLLALLAPLLTQSMVDNGINSGNIGFVKLILIAQLMLFIGSTSINFIRSWILLHISTRISISILTDFLVKLMKLPLSFFATKTTGDIMQRMNDQQKIENFLTGTALNTVFSLLNLVVFTTMLLYYNLAIFFISLIATVLYVVWILMFLKKRRALNLSQFQNQSLDQTTIVDLVNGIEDIKLNNYEQQKRWDWEHVQAKVFGFNVKTLTLNQYQQAGSLFISQFKNIIVTYISVSSVINGDNTLGGMMAIQYIVGQASAPIDQLVGFIQTYQDAKISLERLNEIHDLPDEESSEKIWLKEMPQNLDISLKNITFFYPGAGQLPALKNISFKIPAGKITAIVGMSGSGKTTILKLLLRYFEPTSGLFRIGEENFLSLSFKLWRNVTGSVTHSGFIYNDTLLKNIILADDLPNDARLESAIKISNLHDFISILPNGINTVINNHGSEISQGQAQRLLIARAVYRDPDFLFFDEATNALDANNEKIIMENLQKYFNRRTVVIVAHRLSTIKNADNIIFLDKGEIAEQGNHKELLSLKGKYFELVKNQMEVG